MQVLAQFIQFSSTQYLIKHEYSITFLIKILTRSNIYTNVRFSYTRVRNSKFEFINIRQLVKRKAQPHLFIVYPHPFKLISRRINPSRLLRPPLFYCIYLVVQPPPPAYHSPYNSAHENIYLKKNTAELS